MTENDQATYRKVTPEIMRTLGQIARLVYGEDDLPLALTSTLLARPLTGLGLLTKTPQWHHARNTRDEDMGRLYDKIPADLSATDPVPMQVQGAFWVGYYQFMTAMDAHKQCGPDELAEAGKALYGEHWQTPLTEALALTSTSRIRAWLSGSQRIPATIWQEIIDLLKQKQLRLDVLSKKIEGLANADTSQPGASHED